MNTTSAVEKREKAVDYVSDEGIKVRVTYPDNVNDTIRQQKINKMYDIFLGAMRRITVTRTLLQFSDGCAMI